MSDPSKRQRALDQLLERRRKEAREKRRRPGDDGAAAGAPASSDSAPRGGPPSGGPVPRRFLASERGRAPAPLSFGQERLWFLDRLQPGSAAYNIPVVLELTGSLDPGLLAGALTRLAVRQDALRTVLTRRPDDHPKGAGDGGEGALSRPLQVVRPAAPVAPPRIDLGGLAADVAEAEARRLARREAARPFVLEDAPLARFTLVRLEPGRHFLLCTLHHAIADGWSMGVLVRELAALYRALEAGRGDAGLPELPLRYAGYAAWQRELLRGDELERQVEHWRHRLEGAPALLELPLDRPRPPLQTYRGGRVPVALDADLRRGIEALARARRATPFLVMLAAWSTLLARLAGTRDLVVGTPVAARRVEEVEQLVGFFANTLPLRTDLGGDPPFGELVERLRDRVLEDFEHQDVPFEELVARLRPPRNLSHAPVFQVMLAMQTAPGRPVAGEGAAEADGGLAIRRLTADAGSAKFDLLLELVPTGDGDGRAVYGGALEFNRDLFDAATARRWVAHLETLLRSAVEAPDTGLPDLPLLDPAGRRRVVTGWNDTARSYAGPELLHGRVALQVEATPDAPALRFRGESWSYRETWGRALQRARRLRDLGVGPEARVGVALERSLELPTSLLAVMVAGGAYVPMDPGYPEERLTFMLEDALGDGGVLITEPALAERFRALAPGGVELLVVDPGSDGAGAGAEAPATVPPIPGLDPESPAYAIYTSGSTGRPKGAVNRHRAIVNRLDWMQETFGLGPGDRVLQKTPFSFDVSVWELFWPLMTGAEMVVAEPGGHQDPAYLVATLRDEAITTLHFVPSMLQVFLGEAGLEGCTALRRVIASGEALPPDLVRRFHRRLGVTGARLFNLYGPTEAAVDVTWTPCDDPSPARVPIGRPVANTRMHVVDRHLRPQPPGVAGELLIGGVQLARGYLGRAALTADRFIPDPFAADFEAGTPLGGDGRVYRTGDLGRWLADGDLEYLGRLDHQVKVRGLRIELGEVESALADLPEVREAVVLARTGDGSLDARLEAFVVPADGAGGVAPGTLRDALRKRLPEHMVPTAWRLLEEMPVNPSGKADRKALAGMEAAGDEREVAPEKAETAPGSTASSGPAGNLERRLAAIWSAVLGHDRFSREDNFFDVGGHSLMVVEVQRALRRELGRELRVLDLFRFPTLRSLSEHLRREAPQAEEAREPGSSAAPALRPPADGRIAVVGMAGRFPGAPDLETFWDHLRRGVEALTRYSLEEVLAEGVPEALARDPHYVRAGVELEDPDLFDAAFFDYAPREAQVIDPQQRVFLETAHHALEDAALDPARFPGAVGVFAGAGEAWYLHRIAADPRLLAAVGAYQVLISNRSDYLPTRAAYKLGLTGPAVNVQTACSTSLVAVHLACRALLAGDCDAALAGGVSVGSGRRRGYLHEPGGIASPDGHTRAFDAAGRGTVRGHGAGVVVLRRLEDARADGDPIRAVLLGTAANNDGRLKIGFTAPSAEGQEAVVRAAHRAAGVEPGSLGYVEAHGTATELGDPIEVEALGRAFGSLPAGRVALGSVKTNLGHLDAAAGVAGLIKTVLALEHGELPPSLHYRTPNPKLELESSPFRVQAELGPWAAPEDGGPRRAGISSFGIGGTNAHAVVEEAPPVEGEVGAAPPWVALPLSARSPAALDALATDLAGWLEGHPEASPADVAWTLQTGRRQHEHRRVAVASDAAGAVAALRGGAPGAEPPVAGEATGGPLPLAFLLSGQGAQYPGMARGLYREVPVYREAFDRCAEALRGEGLDLAGLVLEDGDGAAERLRRTAHAQPALFAVEVSLGELLRAAGVVPGALLGHSLGEFVAACMAGVFRLEDALAVVAARGRLMDAMAPGSMLAVELGEEELADRLAASGDPTVELAAVNGPSAGVVSGPAAAVEAFRETLTADGVEARPLHTSHAFHSASMEPALEAFREVVAGVELSPPRIPFLSNLTGTWITAAEATDPDYWVRHLRSPVRFAAGAAELLADPDRAVLEVGPGRTLRSLLRQQPAAAGRTVLPTLRHPRQGEADLPYLLRTLGRLWVAGTAVDWRPLTAGDGGRRRLRLPLYPFQRTRHWVEAPARGGAGLEGAAGGIEPAGGAADMATDSAPAGSPEDLREVAEVSPPEPEGGAPADDDAPRTAVERTLAAAWRDLLGVEGVGRHDDFFDLGGNSLMAVRLASRLRAALGVEVDAHALLDRSTPAAVAAWLAAEHPHLERRGDGEPAQAEAGSGPAAGEGAADGAGPLLVRLREAAGSPLVLVHPVGGHVLYYRHVVAALAAEAGGDRPVLGLRARGLEEGEEPVASVEAMAELYLEGLRRVQPRGPYHLAGSSFGGTVAWEMARRLGQAGETVATLALADTFGPGWMPPRESIALPEHGVPSAYLGGARREELADLRRVRAVMAAHVEAMYAYEPPPWPGRLLYLRASERAGDAEPARPERAWIELAGGGVEIHAVPGGHNSMHAPPHATTLARHLAAALRRGDSEPACPGSSFEAHL